MSSNEVSFEEVFDSMNCIKSVQMQRFFWSVFFPIRTECGDVLRKFLYSVPENTDQKILCIWTLFT